MTTRLEGPATAFLPFNQGDEGGKGNPLNPDGHRTAYLWEKVWERESWLEILGRYLIGVKRTTRADRAGHLPPLPPARRHAEAAGGRARRGRRRSLPNPALGRVGQDQLHRLDGALPGRTARRQQQKVFDSVLVVSDRNVIDAQLQEALFDFERTTGVVATHHGRRRRARAASWPRRCRGSKKIVVCTIQTFPFALKVVRELAATQGKRFAVIADEAHSSQTGEAASKLKDVLSAEELQASRGRRRGQRGGRAGGADGGRAADDSGITFVAFTATPKDKTLELFGTRPDPTSASPRPTTCPCPSTSTRCARPSRRASSSTCCRTTPRTGWRSSWRTRAQEIDDTGGRAQRGAEAAHGLGEAAPVQHRAEGGGRRRALPRARGAAARRAGQGDGRRRQPRGGRALASWRSRSTSRSRATSIGTLVAFSGEVNDPESGPAARSPRPARLLNPGLQGPRHPRGVQGRRATRSCWWPTSSRRGSTSRCCAACTWTSASRASRRCRPSRG